MSALGNFEHDARTNGILLDTNLLVLLMVGLVNRDRMASFKRTSHYTAADWDLLAGILERVPRRYVIPHALSEVNG